MSKVEIVGPREELLAVLTLVRELGIFQLEPEMRGFVAPGEEEEVRALLFDESAVVERLRLEELRRRIDELLGLLGEVPCRASWIDPPRALATVAEALKRHLPLGREQHLAREACRRELAELEHYRLVLRRLTPLLATMAVDTHLDFVGFSLREGGGSEELTRLLAPVTGGDFAIVTEPEADGARFALVALPRALAERVRELLGREQIPELTAPAELAQLPFPERCREVERRLATLAKRLGELDRRVADFGRQWGPIYARMRAWLDDRLGLLAATAAVHQTRMCFLIHGWMPTQERAALERRLADGFGGRVVLQELALLEHDLESAPVSIRNPPYFRPFELFTRLLPLPRYTSYDPTPFLGVFFPIFFGMMLGDAGHGLVILAGSLLVLAFCRKGEQLRDAARIFGVSSLYAIFFGFVYGEFFGEIGAQLLGREHLGLIDRSSAIMPMLFFALGVGGMHVILALVLGMQSALRQGSRKEALFKLTSVVLILAGAMLLFALVAPARRGVLLPALLTAGVALPFLLVSGGLLAPLEMVKHLGNVISYARLMAVGLTSVFLVDVANVLAGKTGGVVSGLVVGALLHILSIVLGLFSPTIHALRLHYVEFFGKFIEAGGRKFAPLKRDDPVRVPGKAG